MPRATDRVDSPVGTDRGAPPLEPVVTLWPVCSRLMLLFGLLLSSCAPQLTPEQRRRDIEYLATWAGDYHPCVDLNESLKGLPGYKALLPRYVELAETARTNEDFLHIAWGYANLIGASGHGYLLDEEMLTGYLLDSLWTGAKGMSDIPWYQFHQASYWAKGYDRSFVHPPFWVDRRGQEYITGSDWSVWGRRIPQGSQILRVNDMTCTAYRASVQQTTWLRNVAGPVGGIGRHLLVVPQETSFKGWTVVFGLPDGSERELFVPASKGLPRRHPTAFTDWRKDNCVCLELAEDVGYIRVKAMVHFLRQKDEKKIRRFLEASGGAYKKLIIDIRRNGGGSTFYVYDTLIRPFLAEPATYTQVTGVKRKFLLDTEPDYLERLRGGLSIWAWETNIEEIEPLKGFDPDDWTFFRITRQVKPADRYHFDGRLFVLMDGGCGSATDTYVDAVKRTGLATLIGQPSAGSMGGYLMATTVRLPESGMIFRMEADLDVNADGSLHEMVGVRPDVVLPDSGLPYRTDKEELLKDPWIQTILNEP